MVVRRRLELKGPALAFITTTVIDWLPIFSSDHLALATIDELRKTLDIYPASVFAYVLMPTHFHAILKFQEIERLSKFIQCFKSMSSRKIKELNINPYEKALWQNGKFQFWKPRFDDFIMRNQKQLEIKVGYIHDNPVRAGLVTKAEDYKYSSTRFWLTGEEGLIEIDTNLGW